MDIAVVGCGVSLALDGDVCVSARVGLGAVAPTVLLVADAGAALRKAGVTAGEHMFPWCASMQEMGSEAMKQKWDRGPTGTLIVRPAGGLAMGKCLAQWFVLCVVTSFCVAYVLSLVLAPGAQNVFRVASAVAFLGYGFGSASNSVWKSVPWSTTCTFVVDAWLSALATGAVFAWMWPAA